MKDRESLAAGRIILNVFFSNIGCFIFIIFLILKLTSAGSDISGFGVTFPLWSAPAVGFILTIFSIIFVKEESEMEHIYYACLESKEGVIKMPCYSEEEANKYLEEKFDEKYHTACWIE